MYSPINPYIAGKPVGNSQAFIGRSDILRQVLRMLRHHEDSAIVLHGQRGIGKTSVLQHLTSILPTQGNYCPIYFDLQDKATLPLAQIIKELAKSIAEALNQTEPDLGEQPETDFIETWLPNLLQNQAENTAIVLLFDEFDVLADPKPATVAFFPYLRQLLNSDPQHLNFVFAMGRDVDDIDQIAVSLFRGIPPTKRLSLLNQQDTTKLIRLSEANNSLNWQDEAIECVWRYTQGHPFITQQLCYHVWEQAYEVAPKTVSTASAADVEAPKTLPTATAADVENVVFNVLDSSRKHLAWLWDSLPPAERVVASALAEAGPQAITESALEKWLYYSGIRVVIRELQEAPRLLQNWDWLESTDNGIRFRVELLRRWVKENKPLRRIQEELDRIEPVADSLFLDALDFQQEGELEASIKQLRDAIGLNPNHLGAQQLLAEILLAQGKAGEAKALLERLYHYKPLAARSRLIQALLELAQQTTNEEQQLNFYEQVLSLEPKQPEATARVREIWQQRGETALAKEDFKTALEVYNKLGLNNKIAEIEQKIRERYFDITKDKKRYPIWLLTILILIAGGVGAYWIQHLEWTSQQQLQHWKNVHLQQELEQANEENKQLEKELALAHGENRALEKALEQANGKKAQFKNELEQANLKVVQLKKELIRLSQKTSLGKFLSRLKKGDQIVIIGSLSQRQYAEKKLEKLNAKYPELFYPQRGLLPDNVENNIYKLGDYWVIFISGFYSYHSAVALKKTVLELDLIEDAFIIKNPFRNRREQD